MGSEMCIRDSASAGRGGACRRGACCGELARARLRGKLAVAAEALVDGRLDSDDAAAHALAALERVAERKIRLAVLL